MTIEDRATRLALLFDRTDIVLADIIDGILQALIEERRIALEEAAHFAWECWMGGKGLAEMPTLIRQLIQERNGG